MNLIQLILITIYAIILLILTYLGMTGKINLSIRKIVLLSLIIHLFISVSFIDLVNYDTISWKLIGTLTLNGKSMYPSYAYFHYPYFPGYNYLLAAAIFFSKFGFPYMLFLKLFFSIFNIANVFLIYLLTKKNLQATFLYAVNPALIFLSAAHGQIEVIPFLFILLTLYLFTRHKEVLIGIVFGFAIVSKVWPLMFLPFLYKYTRKRYVYIISLLIPFLSVLIYAGLFHASIPDILHPPLSYRGGYGSYGLGLFVQTILPGDHGINNFIYKSITNITIIILMVFMLIQKKTNLINEIFIFLLIFSTIVISGANPYWLIPFVLIALPPKWKYWLSIICIYGAVSTISEISHTAMPSVESVFAISGYVTVSILWLINIIIIFDVIKKKSIKVVNGVV
jgi:hypothetical protein